MAAMNGRYNGATARRRKKAPAATDFHPPTIQAGADVKSFTVTNVPDCDELAVRAWPCLVMLAPFPHARELELRHRRPAIERRGRGEGALAQYMPSW